MSDHLPKMCHHPRIGYTFIPQLKKFITGVGSRYLLRTNSDGFRSDYEFEPRQHPARRRALVFGDSQTAGEGISNPRRFTDLIEKQLDGVELYNLALTGTGTDQQYIAWREFGPVLDHDLLVLCIFVENIERIGQKVLRWPDPDGHWHYYGKPYFELSGEGIVLGGVPVPERPWTDATLPEALRLPGVPADGEAATPAIAAPARPGPRARLKGAMRRRLSPETRRTLVNLFRHVVRRKALPAYERADTPHWRLMRGILQQWISESRVPVLLMPIPAMHYLFEANDAAPCLARFRELERETGCTLFDPLPALQRLSPDERRACWNPDNGHLTDVGHKRLADLLAPVIEATLPVPEHRMQPAAMAG